MNPKGPDIKIKVKGEYACFTRPEFKVERVSYPVITPSAARGVLEAIFWKPEIRYQIREIWVLKLGGQTSFLRNEISDKQSKDPINIESSRQQRTSLVLTNVEYVILADIFMRSYIKETRPKRNAQCYIAQFNRRLERGQCHHAPCLGTREFAASFEKPEGKEIIPDLNVDFGTILFDLAFIPTDKENGRFKFKLPSGSGNKEVTGLKKALFFNPKIMSGKIVIPNEKYVELYKLEEGRNV